MTDKSNLSGAHLRTYDKLFQHPVSHNLEWRDVRAMLAELGEMTEQANGHFIFVRHGHTLVLHRPHHKDLADIHELMELRHFVERSEATLPPPSGQDTEVLVMISHHEARVFHSEVHGTPAVSVRSHFSRYAGHAPDSKDFTAGRETPAPINLFEPLAETLQAAKKILLFGSGTGNASEMDLFVTWLKTHHAELVERIVGTVVVDEHHLSDSELLAKARDFYAHLPVAP